MTYNETLLIESTTLLGLVEYVNVSTNDMFVMLMVLSMYLILVLALKRFEFVQAIWAASFVMFFISLFLTFANLLNFMFPLFFISIVGIIAIFYYTRGY